MRTALRPLAALCAAAALAALCGCESLNDGRLGSVLRDSTGGVMDDAISRTGTSSLVQSAARPTAHFVLDSAIEKLLSPRDREAVQQESAEALSKTPDGKPVKWSNPETGASATITPSHTRTEKRKVMVVREKRVYPPSDMQLLGERYAAKKVANLRAGPAGDTAVVGGLAPGESFTAVGRTAKAWILVGRDGRSVGYVHSDLVAPAPGGDTGGELREPVNLDDVELEEGVVAEPVVASTQCRSLRVVVSDESGETAQNSMDACRASDGAWEL
jgi:surface antigen